MVVRVLGSEGEVVGAGFLIDPERMVTCAHVIATALGEDPHRDAAPTTPVRVDFPLFGEPGSAPPSVMATVRRWRPIGADGSGDIAVLALRGELPAGVRMPPLRRIDQMWDQRFRVLGFPEGMADGVWTTGHIRGEQATGWFQLQTEVGEQQIVGGYSGSPVWHTEAGAVVGMTVAADGSGATTTAYLIPLDAVLGVDPELLPCPYRGLEPFGEEHASLFFGRGHDLARLEEVAARQRLVAVAGPSGAGKSSLVRAGLLPRLRARGDQIVEVRTAAALDAALSRTEREQRLVLLVDQFEELESTEPAEAGELLERLVELAERDARRVLVLLTLRSATLDNLFAPEAAALLSTGTVLLPPMRRGQLRDAIVAPAEWAPGLSFELGLVDRILDDAAAEPGQLPLVESLLTELWERREGGFLTVEAYERAGGVAGVVAKRAEQVTGSMDEPQLRRLFVALAGADRDGRLTRRPVRLEDLAPELHPLVHRLIEGRLLVVEAGGEHVVQLAHQAVIEHWPRLRDWLAEDQAFLTWRARLDAQRERWEESGHDDGSLLRGAALAAASDWLPARAGDLAEPSREYVRRSRARQRRDARRWRLVTAVLATLVVLAGVLAAVAVRRGDELGDQLRTANSELLAANALTQADNDPVTATQLALAAFRLDPRNANARTVLAKQFLGLRSVDAVLAGVTDTPIVDYQMSTDGTVLLPDGAGLVVVGGPESRWVVPGVPPRSRWSALSPDGRRLAVADRDGAVWTWDVAARRGPDRLAEPGSADPVGHAFSPDGRRLAWLTPPGPAGRGIEVWDVERRARTGGPLAPLAEADVSDIALGADPDALFVSRGDPVGGSRRLVARSLSNGSVTREYPPGTVLRGSGDAVVSCAGERTAVVQRADLSAELLRIPTRSCLQSGIRSTISRDGYHLVDRPHGARDYSTTRVTNLVDGRTFEVAMPGENPMIDPNQVTVQTLLGVLPARDGAPSAVLGQGTSLLRMRGASRVGVRPDGTGPALGGSDDGRFLIGVEDAGYTVFDAASGRELTRAAKPDAGPGGSVEEMVGDSVLVAIETPDRWVLRDHAFPTLALMGSYTMPRAAGESEHSRWFEVADGRVVGYAGGVVTVWDRASAAPLAPPTRLGQTPAEQGWFRGAANFEARPGHPGQVAALGPDNAIQVWDAVAGRRLVTLPSLGGRKTVSFTFDATGRRLAATTQARTLDIWDVETGELIRPPIPTGVLAQAEGFTEDGHVMLVRTVGGTQQLAQLWEVEGGHLSGSFLVPTAFHQLAGRLKNGRGMDARGVDGSAPFSMPLTGQQWFDSLCRFSNRPFTPAERALLPSGSTIEPPCS